MPARDIRTAIRKSAPEPAAAPPALKDHQLRDHLSLVADMSRKFSVSTVQSDGAMAPEPLFDLKHVVDAVMYMAGLPPEANVLFMTVLATKMPFVGRG